MSQLNLMYAEAAVKYVETTMPFASTNKEDDSLHRDQRNIALPFPDIDDLRSARSDLEAMIRLDFLSLKDDTRDNIPIIFWRANWAKTAGMGNCPEQSYLAFQYLVQDKKLNGVGYFRLYDNNYGDESIHSFVALGLRNIPDEFFGFDFSFLNLIQPPISFLNAVVCDPWYHEWFPFNGNWDRKMRNIIRATTPSGPISDAGYRLRCLAYHYSS